MATSDGYGRRVLRYLESTRNLVGCGGGAVGLGLHFVGLGGGWWPAVVAGLYGAGALLAPAPPPPPSPPPPPPPSPPTDPELEVLAAYLESVPLPASAGVDALLAALRETGPGPAADPIVRHGLPVAVDGYLRARTWLPWAGPDAPDPAAELGREVKQLSAEL
ncbi:hypothetical protein [Kitasatospora cathayae]|uniref:DUF4129 domain-containing protein n=1 Tax=Kitasatospora cathayae TaxID=3004092 RepID=A0ABY7Q9L9_9ACTN|nr:hypothetical protein [Kitasatospora sp. HUAS 3-15]WBP89362.1 hypothetical protein O1G21_28300 [Kitasatospora sp. HUAS 3-15]